MISPGNQPRIIVPNINEELLNMASDSIRLEGDNGKIELANFLYNNLGFTFKLLTGVQLFEIQEIMLNGMFRKDYSMIVAGRGVSKSFTIAAFCCLYPLFFPSHKVCLIANNFRGSRRILELAESFTKGKGAFLIRPAFDKEMKKMQDQITWKCLNGAQVFALPLSNGEHLRGIRANVLIIDEALLISKDTQDAILKPFLSSNSFSDVQANIELTKLEEECLKKGLITEEECFPRPRNKMIMMSSASYQFEYLFQLYKTYIDKTKTYDYSEKKSQPSYFVMRMSYEVLKENTILDKTAVQAAKDTSTKANFNREWRASFVDGSDGFFKLEKLEECTYPDGKMPCVQIVGNPKYEYLIAIDPNASSNETSDNFAMIVFLLDRANETLTQVHTYARADGTLAEHHAYLTYLMKSFNIVYITIDSSGQNFIDGYNSSKLAIEENVNLKFMEVDFNNEDYFGEVRKARYSEYNKEKGKIVYRQGFHNLIKREMNERMLLFLERKQLWFASRIVQIKNELPQKAALQMRLPYIDSMISNTGEDGKYSMLDFLERQDDALAETKKEISLIRQTVTPEGAHKFVLPQENNNRKDADRARKDSYTAVLMGVTGAKNYFDIMGAPLEERTSSFIPFFI